jgi:NAD(P)-dependent dehydrogenase (short-subunit alcohol dehydrogenase family)
MPIASTENPSALVTGVSSGVGLAIAECLLQRGYQVFGSVRRDADASAFKNQWGELFVPLVFDVTDESALPAVVEQVRSALAGKQLGCLINNAGISIPGPLMCQPMEEIRQTFEVNVFATVTVSRAFLPLLGASEHPQGTPGRIINISSVSGAFTAPFLGAYSASKHALEAFTQGFRRELMPYGIHVAAIEPNFIRSKITEKATHSAEVYRYQNTGYAAAWQQFLKGINVQQANAKSPELVTRAVVHAIESPKPRTRYPLDASWHFGRWFTDRLFDKLILKKMGLDKLLRR